MIIDYITEGRNMKDMLLGPWYAWSETKITGHYKERMMQFSQGKGLPEIVIRSDSPWFC